MRLFVLSVLLLFNVVLFSQVTPPFTSNFDDNTFQGWVSNDISGSLCVISSSYPYSPNFHVLYYSSTSNAGIRLSDVQSPGILSFWVNPSSSGNISMEVLFDGIPQGSPLQVLNTNTYTNFTVPINNPGSGDLDINIIEQFRYFFIDEISCTFYSSKFTTVVPIKPWAIILSVIAIGTFLFISQRRFR